MRDPHTLVFAIKYPWLHYPKAEREKCEFNKTYRVTFIHVWHVSHTGDTPTDWHMPHLTKQQCDWLKGFAWAEARRPYFMHAAEKSYTGNRADAEVFYRGLLLQVARCIGVKLSFEEASRQAALAIHRADDDSADRANVFCYLPGWHTNFREDSQQQREDEFYSRIYWIARGLLKRPWFKHPKWRFWEWKITCLPLVPLKRWLFSRCCECGRGFAFGEVPETYQWHHEGPLWFRSESRIAHQSCAAEKRAAYAQNEPKPG